MNVQKQIDEYISGQTESKRADLLALHSLVLNVEPRCKLWFLDGKNSEGKTVSNPNIGYGSYTITYTDGSIREFYRIGLTATSSGISVYVMGIEDKKYLAETFGKDLGKARVTGYCIRFRALKDINPDTLAAALRFGFGQGQNMEH